VVDAEIENFLKEITEPLIKSSGLEMDSIKFFIVNDKNVNAFIFGGQNIFVNTGIFTTFDTPDALLGILSHEIGHIAAGHLTRYDAGTKSATNITFASILLSVGALLTGHPEIAQFTLLGGLSAGQQNVLKYTREQEEIADLIGIQLLEENNLSANALLISMNKFYKEQLDYSPQIEYFLTHPLSRNRKQFIETKVKEEHNLDNKIFNKKYDKKFNFIRAKILSYNRENYKNILKNDYLIYANAISNNSLKDIDYLIKKEPNNPYFYELKADILLRKNLIEKSLENYDVADKILVDNELIKKTIAYIIIKYKQKERYQDAINKLNFTYLINNDYNILKLLAEAYHLNNEYAKSNETLLKYKKLKDEDKKR
jgi:predicted Zn-dependent protease